MVIRRGRIRTAVYAGVLAAALGTTLTACAPGPNPSSQASAHPESAADGTTADPDPAATRAAIASTFVVGVANCQQAREAIDAGVGGIFVPSWADKELLTSQDCNLGTLSARHAATHKATTTTSTNPAGSASGRPGTSPRPLTIAIDFEGGRVQRHADVVGSLPSARQMADTMSPQEVREAALSIGRSLAQQGFTVDFAPVGDVDYANLQVIGDRSFATEPYRAAAYTVAFGQGLQAAGIQPVIKHFPGHGAASGDSHLGTVTTPPLEVLDRTELKVYAVALQHLPTAAVMVGHLTVPGLSSGDLPASLDPAVYALLRRGGYAEGTAPPFTGVVYTDDLSGMLAVPAHMSTAEAARAAFAAGADRLLWSSGDHITDTIDLIQHALDSGEIPRQRLLDATR